MRRELRQQTRQPGAGRDDETPRAVTALGRGHAHAVAVPLPALDRLGEAQRRAMPLGQAQMRLHRSLGCEPTRLRVRDADPVAIDVEDGIASPELRVVDELVGETVRSRAGERSRHELAVGRPHIQTAGLREQRLSTVALELAPQLPRALEERHVARMFVVREPDDARQAAERRERLAAREAIESENALPALREAIRRGAAVGAETGNDRVVQRLAHRRVSRRWPSRRCWRPPRSSGCRPRRL